MILPNFFIVGAPKAGTTSLYHYLDGHPDIYMSNPKEVNFFSSEEIERQKLYYKDFKVLSLEGYGKLFFQANGRKAIGEASVSYLFYREVPLKIKKLVPDAKIIILLRDPAERAFSHYLMDLRLGYTDLDFYDIVFRSPQNRGRKIETFYQQYVELGFYYGQVGRYIDEFGASNVKVILSEELRENGPEVIRDLYVFLGVDESFQPDVATEHNSFTMPRNGFVKLFYTSDPVRKVFRSALPEKLQSFFRKNLFTGIQPNMSDKVKTHLRALYRNDLEKLEKLIGCDLRKWYDDSHTAAKKC